MYHSCIIVYHSVPSFVEDGGGGGGTVKSKIYLFFLLMISSGHDTKKINF